MAISIEDIESGIKFRKIVEIPYSGLLDFIMTQIRKRSAVTLFFWFTCVTFLAMAIYIRITIAGQYALSQIILQTLTGIIIFPLISIPLHEFIHLVPFYLFGARNIRAGMDLSQYIFYVTAHRHVTAPSHFIIVALAPFVIISLIILLLIFSNPGIWKWSLSLFLFLHSTMCAGDFALLNFYWINREKKIYTWDDAEKKIAYFYELNDKPERFYNLDKNYL